MKHTVYSIQYTVYSIQYTVYTIKYTPPPLYSGQAVMPPCSLPHGSQDLVVQTAQHQDGQHSYSDKSTGL